jgi:uncharacterized protein YfaS (alpha-2-macroglobulin family)
MEGDLTSAFETELPNVEYPWFQEWKGPVSPTIAFRTNMKMSREQLENHIRIVSKDKKELLVVVSHYPVDPESGLSPDEIERERLLKWIVEAKEPLEPEHEYALKLLPGMRAMEGDLTSKERQLTKFSTFGSFSLTGLSCTSTKEKELQFLSSGSAKPVGLCDPLNAFRLEFTAPVDPKSIPKGLAVIPDLTGGKSDVNLWEDVYAAGISSGPTSLATRYQVYLPYGLKANASYEVQARAAELKDIFGRSLAGDAKVMFATDHRLPRFVLDNQVSVLEKDTDSKLPVIVNNISTIDLKYQSLTTDSTRASMKQSLTPYSVQDVAYPYPIDVRGLLGGRSGVIQGTLVTKPSTSTEESWFMSQVTPFAVHVKLGHFNSLAWVTSFSTGEPVEGAKVTIVEDTLTQLSLKPKALGTGSTDARGIAELPGTESVDPQRKLSSQWERNQPRLMVRVEKGSEMALIPIGWDFQVYPEGIWPHSQRAYGHLHAWGTTAQGLYKAGDTVQFSIWVRGQNNTTLIPAPRSTYALEVIDPLEKAVCSVSGITLSEFGAVSGECAIPASAAVGWYEFRLKADFSQETLSPLRVLISDFTPAPFKVESRLSGETFSIGSEVGVVTEARLHAGGPYADAGARVTGMIRAAALKASEPRFEGFDFDSRLGSDQQVYQQQLELNEGGDLETSFFVPDSQIPFGDLVVESAVRDDRGKFVTDTARARFAGRDRYVGLKSSEWVLTAGKESTVEALVINEKRDVAPGSPFSVKVEYEDRRAARVKSAGNAYLPRFETEWVTVAECALTSAVEPQPCRFTPQKPGDYRITGTVKDTQGREHTARLSAWAVGKGFVLWAGDTNTQLKVFPERESYNVGEKARFMIQNPFPGAKALFSTERYGIMRSWTETLTEGGHIIEVDVTRDHIPGFFFSAVVTSPRVDKPIEGQVDLGKPAFRMGYAQVQVVDSAKELVVDVKPRGDLFKPRDTVTVDLATQAKNGANPATEFAVTVLDEAVFDLIQSGRTYFDPYKGFYTLDGLDVENFNLIRLLIGRQKFEKKGANAGGDGAGKLDMRSLMKFVSYWNPAVRADTNGKATISFSVPDNLTAWKVFAIAITESDQMGLGVGSFKVNKDLEVRSALPNQVKEGDTFTAGFTVMNRTDRTRPITVDIRTERDGIESNSTQSTITAEPFKRVKVPIEASADKPGLVRFIVEASDGEITDGLTADLYILPKAQLQTVASFGSSDGTDVSETLAFPSNMRGDVGRVSVSLAPSVLGALEGAFEYMRDYPYDCWEQKLSKGIMAATSLGLKGYLPTSFSWKDAAGIAAKMVGDIGAHQAPSGGMCYWTPADDRVDPYLSAYTALALSWLRSSGSYAIPEDKERALHEYLRRYLKGDAGAQAPDGGTAVSGAIKPTVRAVALAALAARGGATSAEVLRYRSSLKEMGVFGKAHYLMALVASKAPADAQREAFKAVQSRFTESSGGLRLIGGESDLGAILDSPMRSQCAALRGFLAYGATSPDAKKLVDALAPKLVRPITIDRKRKYRWENTQENTICTMALDEYAKAYEGGAIDLKLSATLNGAALGAVTFTERRAEQADLGRSITDKDVGQTETLQVKASGTGRYYHTAKIQFAPRDLKQEATNAGFELVREYSYKDGDQWKLLRAPVAVKQGDVIKVDLFLRSVSSHNFVVVDDPIPGGFEAVNRDLRTSSAVDTEEQQSFIGAVASTWFSSDRWIGFRSVFLSFYHMELKHSAARFFADYLPAGNYHLTYTVQAIAPGSFVALPAHAEEMYDPDLFGESSSDTVKIAALQ